MRAWSVAISVIAIFAQAACADPRPAHELLAEYQVLSTKYAADLPGWRPHGPASGSLLFVAPDEYSVRTKSFGGADHGADLDRARGEKYAAALFALAKQAAESGQMSLAFQWATETLRENPDHPDARRVLGYEQRNGRWLTPYGVRMAEGGKAWHPKFGWVAETDVARYEAGERFVGARWVSARDDDGRKREMKNGWQVRTDHFLVTTTHSPEAAAELAARLERLHQVWRQLFAGFYLTENEVRRLFAGERQPRKQLRPFRVYYHRDRDEYVNALRRRQPRIADTLGIYFDEQREAHFFAEVTAASSVRGTASEVDAVEPPMATLFHEAVHQLFQESRPAARHVGELANFWVIEGVATYFETLREHADPVAGLYYTIGESDAGRLPAARERMHDGFYVPLAELTRLGKNDLQRHADISKLYSQSSGLAAFLMDGASGAYREALVRYLVAVYSGRDHERSLAEAAGVDYSVLDDAYRRHMQSLP